jgi:uncharacterized repeat protein (TIGR01451 family)
MKTTLSKHLRRTSLLFNALGTISIILSLVMAFFPQTGASAEPVQQEVACGPCDGQIDWMVWQYTGAVTIEVYVLQNPGGLLADIPGDPDDVVTLAPGDTLEIFGTWGSWNTLGTNIEFYVDGVRYEVGEVTSVHTSCSDPGVIPGFTFGDFLLLNGTSRNNGYLVCPLPEIAVDKVADPIWVWEPGDTVTFTVTVTNVEVVPVTLNSLVDDVFGDVTLIAGSTCTVPQSLAAGGEAGDSYTCEFSYLISGQPTDPAHQDWVTASATDADDNPAEATDDATVTFEDILPSITIEKTADPTLVPETGDTVTYSLTVTNTSSEDLTLDSLIDDIYGDLNGQGGCCRL